MSGGSQQSCRHAGFTLIEVMVSIVVLAIGVVGVAGMQLNAYRMNQQSAFATSAVQLAQDIAERIRANSRVATLTDADNPYLFDTGRKIVEPAKTCFANQDCSAADIARRDVYEWANLVAAPGGNRPGGLPGGRGVVCRDASPWETGRGYRWACNGGPAAPIVVKLGWLEKHADGSLVQASGKERDDRPWVVIPVRP